MSVGKSIGGQRESRDERCVVNRVVAILFYLLTGLRGRGRCDCLSKRLRRRRKEKLSKARKALPTYVPVVS